MHPLIINPVMIVLEETQPNADAAAQNAKFSLNFWNKKTDFYGNILI